MLLKMLKRLQPLLWEMSAMVRQFPCGWVDIVFCVPVPLSRVTTFIFMDIRE